MTAAAIPGERALADPRGACIAGERLEPDDALRAGGDVLAIMLPNRVELITSMFAAWRPGAAVTPVNPAPTAHEARYQVDDAAAAPVVADDASAQKLQGRGRRIIAVQAVSEPDTRCGRAMPAPASRLNLPVRRRPRW